MSNDIDSHEAFQIALNYCNYRERSQREVEDKLLSKKISKNIILSCIKKLKELNVINNIRFSQSFARGKNRNNRWGKKKIKYHLLAKGLNSEEIEFGLNCIEEEDYINSIKKSIEIFLKLNKNKDRNKLINHLISKGYEIQIINITLSGVDSN